MGHSLRGTLLERHGKLEEAANALEHAVQLGERKLATFQLLVAVRTRLAANLLGSSPGKAEQSLRKALEVDSRSPTARRMLASLLASRGDPAYLEEAEELLRSVDPTTASVAVEDIRLNGFLLAQYGEATGRQRGVELLEGVVAKGDASTADDRIILAQIYESQAHDGPIR